MEYSFYWNTKLTEEQQIEIQAWIDLMTVEEQGMLEALLEDAKQQERWDIEGDWQQERWDIEGD